MPIIWDHLTKNDIQLSVVSLPWFLSLYINSMPLIFAFRVLDVFFLEGPKVLFQVGLAILRINGEELLDATDDGTFISVLKSYFARLGDSAHPTSENPKHRAITNFQALMVVAFKEFDGITQASIAEQRSKHKATVLDSIESFAKRTSIRNLGPESKKLSPNDLGFLYDRFYSVLYERQQRAELVQQAEEQQQKKKREARLRATEVVSGISGNNAAAPEIGRVALGASQTEMDYDAFREFLAGIARWAVTDSPTSPVKDDSHMHKIGGANGGGGYFQSLKAKPSASNLLLSAPWGSGPEPAEHEFLRRLFKKWDVDGNGALSLQNVVGGLAPIKGDRDLMGSISYFFELYDDDGDGRVDREGILRISEALLFLSRRGVPGGGISPSPSMNEMNGMTNGEDGKKRRGTGGRLETKDEQFLSAVSAFIRRCFEYADPDRQEQHGADDLLDLGDTAEAPSHPLADAKDDGILARPSTNSFGQTNTKPRHAEANAALDPSSPVHITLPTFRMLVLADETLESFFDAGFANSFHLADAPLPSSTITAPSFLQGAVNSASPTTTTATNAGVQLGGASATELSLGVGGAGAGVVPPGGQGLRGMLDNIVTDGMRVAAEVRRRMDEAQRELDKGASTRGTEDDEDDEEDQGQDLLEGAEADAGGSGEVQRKVVLDKGLVEEPRGSSASRRGPVPVEMKTPEKSTMFER